MDTATATHPTTTFSSAIRHGDMDATARTPYWTPNALDHVIRALAGQPVIVEAGPLLQVGATLEGVQHRGWTGWHLLIREGWGDDHAEPEAGAVFAFETDARGAKPHAYAG